MLPMNFPFHFPTPKFTDVSFSIKNSIDQLLRQEHDTNYSSGGNNDSSPTNTNYNQGEAVWSNVLQGF